MNKKEMYNSVLFPADTGGCGFYRMIMPKLSLQTIARNIRVVESTKLIGDPKFFQDVRMVRLQRQVNDAQANYFLKFLKPLSEQYGFWIQYELDDVIKYEDIPLYNHGRIAYDNKQFFANVKNMLNAADIITVTTDRLKQYYAENYDVPDEKFQVIPNYLPRWWGGESYDLDKQVKSFRENVKRPRIVFPMSSSHFDIKGLNNYQDDFTQVAEFIRSTYKKYDFTIIGHAPKLIEDLVKDKKVTVAGGSDLLNYPRELNMRNFHAIIAPLQDNVFNRCKSAIKLHEGWGAGLPVIAQDLECYNKHTDMLFKDNNQLQNQLDNLFNDDKKYRKIVKNNRSKIDNGYKQHPNGLWIEKNIQKWYDLFTLPQKTLSLDLQRYTRQVRKSSNDGIINLDLKV